MKGSKFTDEEKAAIIEQVLDKLRTGAPEYNAAESAGITFNTWFNWRDTIPGLRERTKEAKRCRIILWEDALHKAALKGSVTAILALLEKEDKGWRDRAKDLTPQHPTFVFNGNAAVMIKMLEPEKRQKLLVSMIGLGLLPETVEEIGANGSAPPE